MVIERAAVIAEVWDGFRAGRGEAVEIVRGWVRAVVFGGNWRFDDAEGIVQETLLRLVRLVRDGRVDEAGAFQKYVYTVSKHICVRSYHRQRRRDSVETDEIATEAEGDRPGPDAGVESRERLELLAYIFQRLPAACRELWNLVYRDGLATGEVADKLGISTGNARVRVHRCLKKAREIRADFERWPAPPTPAGGE